MQKAIMEPVPGSGLVHHVGDQLTIRLRVQNPEHGRAVLRTTIGCGQLLREIATAPLSGSDRHEAEAWRDIEMQRDGDGWSVTVLLTEAGWFQAKARFVDAAGTHHWPSGEDLSISVHPAWTRDGNVIYCAFTRQFGETRQLAHTDDSLLDGQLANLEAHGYATLPPSGTLRDLSKQCDHIFTTLGCRILHLLPINPTPTSYARFGRFGSPYAALDFTAIDPALVEFDKRTTALDQFAELVDAVHRHDGRLIIDLAINHTGWGSQLMNDHPDWFCREDNGDFHSPGAWGVTWEDLVELDHDNVELWKELQQVFLTWCERGVDGFRCDAGYMVPLPAWRAIIAAVRQHFPETVFLLEGLGGAWEVTEDLLRDGGMQWAYSELFQNYDAANIRSYVAHCHGAAAQSGVLVHYSETHDNDRLAKQGKQWSQHRNRLCALTSIDGGFAYTAGVEWLATEKIAVHRANALNWGSPDNIVADLRRLADLLQDHPCFLSGSVLHLVGDAHPHLVAWQRQAKDGSETVFIVTNVDQEQAHTWPLPAQLHKHAELIDLVDDSRMTVQDQNLHIPAGATLCLAPEAWQPGHHKQERYHHHRLAGLICQLFARRFHPEALADLDIDSHVTAFVASPEAYLTALVTKARSLLTKPDSSCTESAACYPALTFWTKADARRCVMIPAQHRLLVENTQAFRCRISQGDRTLNFRSYKVGKRHLVILHRRPLAGDATILLMDKHGEHHAGSIRFLDAEPCAITDDQADTILLTNGRGGMAHVPASLHGVISKYDCLLGANLDSEIPTDRHVLVKNFSAWLRLDGIGNPITAIKQRRLHVSGMASWQLDVPIGGGKRLPLSIRMAMVPNRNTTVLSFHVHECPAGHQAIELIVRFSIEDRNFHTETHQSTASDKHFSAHLNHEQTGFRFEPAADRKLHVHCHQSVWHAQPEWQCAIPHPLEGSRGQQDHGDAYTPGWFAVDLRQHSQMLFILDAETDAIDPTHASMVLAGPSTGDDNNFDTVLDRACRQFVVKREDWQSVIAGYPWFLDWGRDTLICARGLLAIDMVDEVRDIVTVFGRFADQGTLPNCIHGADASNRDTSDAPLWYGIVCEDLAERLGPSIYQHKVADDGRDLVDVLLTIARGYRDGTPNGIHMDADSGLIWSPSHFTWMDTNHPAGTPRMGYPIEIQAMFWRLTRQLARLRAAGETRIEAGWDDLADRVAASVRQYFTGPEPWLADCLVGPSGTAAAGAQRDGALRSNALKAITLGLIDGTLAQQTVSAAARYLLVPGAIRSLADLPVALPLAVHAADGALLNDPFHPYQGRYEGDEDSSRKVAYHNGTAWTWPFPGFCEALVMAWPGDNSAKAAAKSYLSSCDRLLQQGCLAQLPEIVDGDFPHTQRGCDAQAWGATEAIRVWRLLDRASD